MYLIKCVILYCAFFSVICVKTLLKNNSPFFTFRRYLDFPKGSTFIATGSFIKRLLFTQEGGYYAVLGEMDVPFTLPSYNSSVGAKSRFLNLHKREITRNIKELLTQSGLDMNCLDSIFCELDRYEFSHNMQFTKHLLKAIATYFEEHGLRKADGLFCEVALNRCGMSLLPSIIDNVFSSNSNLN